MAISVARRGVQQFGKILAEHAASIAPAAGAVTARYTANMQAPVKHRSAGIVVVRRADGAWRVLILRTYRNWDFPKGLIEPGEEPLAAATRETREESGLTDLDFRWGQGSIDTGMYGNNKIATFFLAATRTEAIELPVNPELGHPEHNEYRWAGFDQARRLLPKRLAPVLDWAGQRLDNAATTEKG
ncbi:MAG TPA: NUDIX domain-containing protein [Acidiferrobacterales bacterium]